jgi:hypothetical protein
MEQHLLGQRPSMAPQVQEAFQSRVCIVKYIDEINVLLGSSMGAQPGAFGNPGKERKTDDPVGFWDNGNDQDTDWANGNVKTGIFLF